jgi:hypothetical protein
MHSKCIRTLLSYRPHRAQPAQSRLWHCTRPMVRFDIMVFGLWFMPLSRHVARCESAVRLACSVDG